MTKKIFKAVDCCKGARKPYKFIQIHPRHYVCKPGEIVELTLKNFHKGCDPSCWTWYLRSGPGYLTFDTGSAINYYAPQSFRPEDCAAIIDLYCGGRLIDSISISTNVWMGTQLAYITTGFWLPGGWHGKYIRDPTAPEIEELTQEIWIKEGAWRDPTPAEIEKLTQEIHAGYGPLIGSYEGYSDWCWGRIPLSYCIYIYRFDCAGRLLHRDVRCIRCHCYTDVKKVIKMNEDRWFSYGLFFGPTSWAEQCTGDRAICMQASLNQFVLPFVSSWNYKLPKPLPGKEVVERIKQGYYLKRGGILDLRTPAMIDKGCCIPLET
ncbi:hypothetical protein ES702_04557 [subsurface metagenome]